MAFIIIGILSLVQTPYTAIGVLFILKGVLEVIIKVTRIKNEKVIWKNVI